ncbi:MAG: phospholipase D-like domain-containing protein [Verrucomicrobiales bacterium]|nr:phospholipase D-like domain-containing protein [Verrucomicrobiales bacterium]
MTELLLNEAAYKKVIQEAIPGAKRFVWIATADLKDLHVETTKGRYVPFVSVLADLVSSGVGVRLIHAKEPGPRFRKDFDRFPDLIHSDLFERVLCPRMHAKMVIVDGRSAYLGSANLTGAGIGAKSVNRRNFEAGVFLTDPKMVSELCEYFDEFWIGNSCIKCGRRDVCPDPIV